MFHTWSILGTLTGRHVLAISGRCCEPFPHFNFFHPSNSPGCGFYHHHPPHVIEEMGREVKLFAQAAQLASGRAEVLNPRKTRVFTHYSVLEANDSGCLFWEEGTVGQIALETYCYCISLCIT